jgi:gamma-glutamyl-gamma-aminobutyrate hydrolase PuuD
MQQTKILIVNDTRDVGVPYTPFFETVGSCTEDIGAFNSDPTSFDLVVFTGGSDVSPHLYKDTSPNRICQNDPMRDAEERLVFNLARGNGVSMFGICRGLQFLNVMTGGSMIHHLNGHSGTHSVNISDGDEFPVNSYHHQACIPGVATTILAWSSKQQSKTYYGAADEKISYLGPEVEALYMPEAMAAGVQWHPEALKPGDRGYIWARHLARDIIKLTIQSISKLYLNDRPSVTYA